MNLNPNQPEETIDESLLDEALAQATPAELEAKILALTDPPMLSLLEEALAPEQASDELTQRILAATTGQAQHEAPAVLARISPTTITFRYAAAAAILLAVGLGVWFVNQDPADTDDSFVITPDTPSVVNNDASTDEPDWLMQEQFVSETVYFDSTTGSIEGTLEDAADGLDDVTITRDTLWAELDAYEQFLDEFES